jgi:hypothetical protein
VNQRINIIFRKRRLKNIYGSSVAPTLAYNVAAKHNRDQAMEEKLSNEMKQESELDTKVEK